MKFDEYANNLSLMVAVCESTLGLLEGIKNETVKLPDKGTAREEIAQIITEFLVIKLYCLFDDTGNAMSFEKITRECKSELGPEKERHLYEIYSGIKKKHPQLINRLKNNRNLSIAHSGKNGGLGWDKITLDTFKSIWGDKLKNIPPVQDKYVYLTAWNFPIDEAKEMLKELHGLIYQFWFPNVAMI